MMRAWLFILLISGLAAAQDDYTIDHYLEYDVNVHDHEGADFEERYYVNSADNSYNAMHRNPSATPSNFFFESYGKFVMHTFRAYDVYLTDAFYSFAGEHPYTRNVNWKRIAKNYTMSPVRDTVIEGRSLIYVHLYKNKKEKKGKKGQEENVLSVKMVFDPTQSSFHPLLTHPLSFQMWKSKGGVPKGMLVAEYFYDGKNVLKLSRTLKNAVPISTTFKVPRPRYRVRQGAVVAPYSSGTRKYTPSSGSGNFEIYAPADR
jgi:hypothetical protein